MIGKKIQDLQLAKHKCCPAAIKHWAAPLAGAGALGGHVHRPQHSVGQIQGEGITAMQGQCGDGHGKAPLSGRAGAARGILCLAQPP